MKNPSHSNDVLIVTSALQPPDGIPFVQMRSASDRWHQTLCSLASWIKETPLRRIVVCDNSGTSLPFEPIRQLAREHGKEMETLIFRGDVGKLSECGKGYGEGEILAHAFEHSRFLRETDSFYKITGRIFIKNFAKLHAQHLKDPIVFSLPGVPWKNQFKRFLLRFRYFQRRFDGRSAYTVFYKSSKVFFRRHLLERYLEVDELNYRWLEHVYFLPVMKHSAVGFKTPPIVVGLRGTSGETYEGHTYAEEIKTLARRMAEAG